MGTVCCLRRGVLACDLSGGAKWATVCASIRPRRVVLVFNLPAFLSFLYLAATWPQTHICARGKGVTHIMSLADQTSSHGNTRMHKRTISNCKERARMMSVDDSDKFVTV